METGSEAPVVVQPLKHTQLFAAPCTTACQAPRPPTSQSLLKFMSVELWCYLTISSSVSPVLLWPLIFPSFRVFSNWVTSSGQNIGASASASVLPMNIQDWFSLELTSLISLQSKRLSGVFSSTTILKHQFFGAQPSLWSKSHICMWLLEKP